MPAPALPQRPQALAVQPEPVPAPALPQRSQAPVVQPEPVQAVHPPALPERPAVAPAIRVEPEVSKQDLSFTEPSCVLSEPSKALASLEPVSVPALAALPLRGGPAAKAEDNLETAIPAGIAPGEQKSERSTTEIAPTPMIPHLQEVDKPEMEVVHEHLNSNQERHCQLLQHGVLLPHAQSSPSGQRPERALQRFPQSVEDAGRRRQASSHPVQHAKPSVFVDLSSLDPGEARRLRGALEALGCYKRLLQENSLSLAKLQQRVADSEAGLAEDHERAEELQQEVAEARHKGAEAEAACEQWRLRGSRRCDELATLRERQERTKAELRQLEEEVRPARLELQEVRERLEACEVRGRQQGARLSELRCHCQGATSELQAHQLEEMATRQASHAEERAKLDAAFQGQLSQLRSSHLQALAELQAQLAEAERRRDELRYQRELQMDELMRLSKDKQELQRDCAEARDQLAVRSRRRELDSSFASSTKDSRDYQVRALRNRCRDLEQTCLRTHQALEKRHAECEQWRRKVFEPSGRKAHVHGLTKSFSAALPFTLGPEN